MIVPQGRRPNPALRRDYREIGCAYCRTDVGGDRGVLPYGLPPPWASLDARDDARLHPECYRALVFAVWAILGFAPIPEGFM